MVFLYDIASFVSERMFLIYSDQVWKKRFYNNLKFCVGDWSFSEYQYLRNFVYKWWDKSFLSKQQKSLTKRFWSCSSIFNFSLHEFLRWVEKKKLYLVYLKMSVKCREMNSKVLLENVIYFLCVGNIYIYIWEHMWNLSCQLGKKCNRTNIYSRKTGTRS